MAVWPHQRSLQVVFIKSIKKSRNIFHAKPLYVTFVLNMAKGHRPWVWNWGLRPEEVHRGTPGELKKMFRKLLKCSKHLPCGVFFLQWTESKLLVVNKIFIFLDISLEHQERTSRWTDEWNVLSHRWQSRSSDCLCSDSLGRHTVIAQRLSTLSL